LEDKRDIVLQVITLVLEISKSKNINPEILNAITILIQALMINPAAADIGVLILNYWKNQNRNSRFL